MKLALGSWTQPMIEAALTLAEPEPMLTSMKPLVPVVPSAAMVPAWWK